MRINVFAGARRIALLISALVVAGTVAILVTSPPYVSIKARIDHPTAPFLLTEEGCSSPSARHYFSSPIPGKRPIGVELCLKAMDFQGVPLIPYKTDANGMVYGAASYSEEVHAYEQGLKKRFQLSQDDLKSVKKTISQHDARAWKDGLLYLAIAVAVFWIAVWGIGWIVRGFAGIPMGKDHRQTGNDS